MKTLKSGTGSVSEVLEDAIGNLCVGNVRSES